jgi:hypothetical protein
LHFNGKEYKFKMSGVPADGISVTNVDAVGAVYNIEYINNLHGVYSKIKVNAAAVKSAGASS